MTQTCLAGDIAASWIYVVLFALFILVCLRLRGNMKFVRSLMRDLVGIRDRENMFDDTMRETSVIFFMLLLSGCSLGVLLLGGVRYFGSRSAIPDFMLPLSGGISGDMPSVLACMAIACGYILIMWIAYNVVGRVFSDSQHTWVWVRGFTAGTGLGAVAFFPLALLALAYPAYAPAIVAVGLATLILVKTVYVVKGFRIFFTESSSWVVFLYYLCSLEMVPLAMTFGLAVALLG
ncbi:MAG: DUF4271 domain-containing protein [Muribaculaceae bacterium]|nr:DUF4271 domain-containing protein [Muribaculaceae bacterium]